MSNLIITLGKILDVNLQIIATQLTIII